MDEEEILSSISQILGLASITPLKRGGQKIVYHAIRGGSSVVLKVVFLDRAADPNALERCAREVALLKSIESRNVVKVLSDLEIVGTSPSAAAWLEEELDGEDLSELLHTQWSWEDTASLLHGVGQGLTIMHQNGFVHRDLSCGNVRRTSEGCWKVMDPGFAKHLNRSSITGLWQPGTVGYMSPEHVTREGHITPATDVFCLGILAYQVLVGKLPIPRELNMDLYRRALLETQAPTLRTVRPDILESQAKIVDTCLQRQPARRYLNAGELVIALDDLRE